MKYLFTYSEDMKQMINEGKIIYKDELDWTKGLSVGVDWIVMNLSAKQFKEETDDTLISELSKTLTHETVHCLITKEIRITSDGEEHIVRILAEQEDLRLTPIKAISI